MLTVKRIKTFDDIQFIYYGIWNGVKEGHFTHRKLLDTLNEIQGRDITFYIFEDTTHIRNTEIGFENTTHTVKKQLGFGAVRNEREVYHVYVLPKYRNRGYGTRISLWLKQKILEKDKLPICFVKNGNRWQNRQRKLGMVESKDYNNTTVNRYVLKDFTRYMKALKRYRINRIKLEKR